MTDGAVRISADRELCIQAGNCVMVAGEVFGQDDDGIVTVLADEVSGEAADHAREAVNLCPANALALAGRSRPSEPVSPDSP